MVKVAALESNPDSRDLHRYEDKLLYDGVTEK